MPDMWHRVKLGLDKLLRCFGVLGIGTLWLCVSALCISVIRPHFLRLLYRSLLSFTNFKGTTPWGFISSDIVQPVLLLVFFVVLLRKSHGKEAATIHVRRDFLIGLKAIGLLVIFWYLPIVLFKGVRLVYDDHQMLVAKNQSLSLENVSLHAQVTEAMANAELRCKEANGKEIAQLKKERNAVCYRPDRRLIGEDREHLFLGLRRLAQDLVKNGKTPTIRIYAINCDEESRNFAQELQKIFQDAGWVIEYPISEREQKEAQEQYDWVNKNGNFTGVVIFDKDWPGGYISISNTRHVV
jgi:hypothetical protein